MTICLYEQTFLWLNTVWIVSSFTPALTDIVSVEATDDTGPPTAATSRAGVVIAVFLDVRIAAEMQQI